MSRPRAEKFAVLATLFFALVLGLVILWERGTLPAYLQAELVKQYVARVAPRLPFQIEKAKVESRWKDFRAGRITDLSLVLHWGEWRLDLAGPIEFGHAPQSDERTDILFKYTPLVSVEPARAGVPSSSRSSPPIPFEISAVIGDQFSHLDHLRVSARADRLDWKLFKAHAEGLSFAADYSPGFPAFNPELRFSLDSRVLNWGDVPQGRAVNTRNLALNLHAPLALKPFAFGPDVHLLLAVADIESTWDGAYLDLPLAGTEVELDARLAPQGLPQTAALRWVHQTKTLLSLSAEPRFSPRAHLESLGLSWKTARFPIRALREQVAQALATDVVWPDLELGEGTVETAGQARLMARSNGLKPQSFDARLQLRNLSLKIPRLFAAADGIDLDLAASNARNAPKLAQGKLSARTLRFRKYIASLAPTAIDLSPELKLRVGGVASPSSLPLKIKNLPLALGPLKGSYDLARKTWSLATSLTLPPTPIEPILRSLCAISPQTSVPPAKLRIDFDHVALSPGTIDPTGSIRLDFFDGTLQADDIGFYELGTAVPETDFSLKLENVRLDELGNWLGFGEMDGILRGHAEDVTLQGWLPTQYDFLFEAKPLHRKKIVFSPDAMKSLIHVVSGAEIDQLPKIAQWLAFGWPKRLVGGYDVQYAGLSVVSKEGQIEVRTLDPQPKSDPLDANGGMIPTRKHYILYGEWFKMPLQSPHYPLVMDAPALENYVRKMIVQLQGLAAAKAKARQKAGPALERKKFNESPSKIATPVQDPPRQVDSCWPDH